MSVGRNRNLFWFIALLSLVISSNILLYRLEMMQPLPNEIALGTLFDFLFIIPLLTYFFIIRKCYSLKYLVLVVFAGYGSALMIIPQGYLGSYSFVKYILIAGEGAFILLELYLVFKLVTKLPAILKYYKTKESNIPAFPYRMEQALTHYVKPNRFIEIVSSEITMFYYSFFSWRKNPVIDGQVFTFHKKTSAVALYIMMIHALILESVGFHFLLHNWSPTTAFIALILNGYTLLFFLAEIQAIRLVPFIITGQYLYLQVGMVKRLTVPLEEIKSVHYYQGPEKVSRDVTKQLFNAVLSDFVKERPAIEIEFHSPQEVKKMYGIKQKVLFAHLSPDEPQKFLDTLKERIS
jgi:membrane protein YdbS with pleckstrin-like domain